MPHKDPDKYREYHRLYMRKWSKEKKRAACHKHYWKDPEMSRLVSRQRRAIDPIKARENERRRRQNRLEEINTKARLWRRNNPEKAKERDKVGRERYKEKRKASHRTWQVKHRHEINEHQRERYHNNWEEYRRRANSRTKEMACSYITQLLSDSGIPRNVITIEFIVDKREALIAYRLLKQIRKEMGDGEI